MPKGARQGAAGVGGMFQQRLRTLRWGASLAVAGTAAAFGSPSVAQSWQLAGQDPTDAFRGLKVTDQEVQGLLDRPFGASWGQTV